MQAPASAGRLLGLANSYLCRAAAVKEPAALQQATVARLLSGGAASTSSPAPCVVGEDQQQRQGDQQRQRRRLSQYAASFTGRHDAAAGPWRAFSSSSSSSSSRRGSGPSDRGFASQPAFAYQPVLEEASTATSAARRLQHHLEQQPPPHVASAAETALKARAVARMQEARAGGAAPGIPNRNGARPRRGSGEEQDLKRVQEVEDMAPQLPVWERLARLSSGLAGARVESTAALQSYQQEVLHGQDPEAAASAAHIPFLRSGMYAAEQGYVLQTELSRTSAHSRLLPESGGMSSRTASALTGLAAVMDASRSAGSAEPTQYVPGRPPVVEGTADSNAIVRGPVPAAAAAGTAAAASAGQKEQQAQHADEDDDAHALAELLGWEEQHQELQLQAAATASASAAARRRQLQELWEGYGRGRKQQRRRAARACAADLKPLPPAVSCAEVMAALEGVEGVRRRSIEDAVSSLYGGYRAQRKAQREMPLFPLQQPTDPGECLRGIREMAQLLVQDIGSKAFEALVNCSPWVLLLDAQTQGRPQLGCLHVIDMRPRARATLLRSYPRLLMADAEDTLLPTFEYLQSLGMSNRQMAHLLLSDYTFCQPSALEKLKALAAFWLGKGMAKRELVKLIVGFPKMVHLSIIDYETKLDWAADHLGLSIRDVEVLPPILYRSLTNSTGPRTAFALSKGFVLLRPSDGVHLSGGRKPLHDTHLGMKRFMRLTNADLAKRLRTTVEEYEAFKEDWLRTTFPAWMERRRRGIEHYRVLTGSRHRPTPGAAAALASAAAASQRLNQT